MWMTLALTWWASGLARLEASGVARTVGGSTPITAALSSMHLLGFTLLMGAALVSNLRLMGLLLPDRPLLEITRPAAWAIAAGLCVSVTTGVLLFAARATTAAASGAFQLKMILLVAAVVAQFWVQRRVTARARVTRFQLRAVGGLGLTLWGGVAAAACAFILLE
jgi:uncharacterized protein DUF6644